MLVFPCLIFFISISLLASLVCGRKFGKSTRALGIMSSVITAVTFNFTCTYGDGVCECEKCDGGLVFPNRR